MPTQITALARAIRTLRGKPNLARIDPRERYRRTQRECQRRMERQHRETLRRLGERTYTNTIESGVTYRIAADGVLTRVH